MIQLFTLNYIFVRICMIYNYENIYKFITIDCGILKAEMERESLLKTADHVWKLLDNMAESNPEAYQRFIQMQLQEGSTHFKPPEPIFCLSCEIDKATSTNALFINVCQWCQVPKPKTNNDAIPVKGGTLRRLDQTAQVYDVAFNPAIIEESARQEDIKEQLVQLILDYTIDMTKLAIKRNTCKRLDKKFIGSLQDITSSIDERHQQSSVDNSRAKKDQPQSLLDQLANINQETDQEPDIVLPNESTKAAAPSKKLIEEISSSDKRVLRYSIDTDGEKLTVTIQVGKDAKSIAEAELDVSENELELQVPGIPDRLTVKLPHTVDKDTVVAKYQPKTGRLCVTMIHT